MESQVNVKKDELDTIDKETGNERLCRMLSSRLRMEEPCTWLILYDALNCRYAKSGSRIKEV